MKKLLIYTMLLLNAYTLSASTIPTYQISSVENNMVSFTNNSTFQVAMRDAGTLVFWDAGDTVEMQSDDADAFRAVQLKTIDGRMTVCDVVRFHNLTKSNEFVEAALTTAPVTIGPGTFAIVTIDLTHRLITLSNSSIWLFAPEAAKAISQWQPTQLVMIGREMSPLSSYDVILLNTHRQSVARALQQ